MGVLATPLVAGMVVVACALEEPEPELEAPLPVDGAVSSDTPEATIAGLDILARGGNAVDAAVAVSLVLGVTEPSESGLGGSAVMLIVPEGGDGVVLDGGSSEGAAGGAGLPTALRVLHHAWSRYGSGKLEWAELVEPAVRAAADGFTLGRFTHRTIVREYDSIITDRAATLQLLAPDRSIPAEASVLTNPQLAAVLERVALDGPEAFYAGEVGQRLVAALSAEGVPIDVAQLAATPAARELRAVQGSYRRLTVWVPPEPHGGAELLRALSLLELAPRSWIAPSGWARTGWLAEALAYAWGDGREHPVEHLASIGPMPSPQGAVEAGVEVGDPTAPRRGRAPAARPDSGAPRPVEPRRPIGESPGATSHVSVVDDAGLAVSMTQTLGGSFGSGPVEGLGFFYQRGHDAEGAPVVPTVATREGRLELVLGSPGGERGVAAVVQVLFRVLELEQPLEDAIGARRLYVSRATPESRGRVFFEGVAWQDTLSVRESAYAEWGASVDVLARARGFEVGEQGRGPVVEGLHPWFGGVNAIRRSGASWEAVGDERRGGVGGVLQKGAPTLQRTDAGAIRPPAAPEG